MAANRSALKATWATLGIAAENISLPEMPSPLGEPNSMRSAAIDSFM